MDIDSLWRRSDRQQTQSSQIHGINLSNVKYKVEPPTILIRCRYLTSCHQQRCPGPSPYRRWLSWDRCGEDRRRRIPRQWWMPTVLDTTDTKARRVVAAPANNVLVPCTHLHRQVTSVYDNYTSLNKELLSSFKNYRWMQHPTATWYVTLAPPFCVFRQRLGALELLLCRSYTNQLFDEHTTVNINKLLFIIRSFG